MQISVKKLSRRLRLCVGTLCCAVLLSCAAPILGHGGNGPRFADLEAKLRPGFDDKKSVTALLGAPHRKITDAVGRDIYLYVWADGKGGGEECIIAFNTNGVVYLVDAAQ